MSILMCAYLVVPDLRPPRSILEFFEVVKIMSTHYEYNDGKSTRKLYRPAPTADKGAKTLRRISRVSMDSRA